MQDTKKPTIHCIYKSQNIARITLFKIKRVGKQKEKIESLLKSKKQNKVLSFLSILNKNVTRSTVSKE